MKRKLIITVRSFCTMLVFPEKEEALDYTHVNVSMDIDGRMGEKVDCRLFWATGEKTADERSVDEELVDEKYASHLGVKMFFADSKQRQKVEDMMVEAYRNHDIYVFGNISSTYSAGFILGLFLLAKRHGIKLYFLLVRPELTNYKESCSEVLLEELREYATIMESGMDIPELLDMYFKYEQALLSILLEEQGMSETKKRYLDEWTSRQI